MPFERKLIGLGMAAPLAEQISGQGAQNLTATGSTAADALLVASNLNAFVGTASGTGTILSFAFTPGDEVVIFNGGSNTLTIYPPTGGTIDNASSASIVVNKSIKLLMCTNTAWTSTKST